ncbi:unnamed protein product, partial [Adineta ricciae]
EDIDGATLALFEQNNINQIFPRIKDRVKFTHERAKLIASLNEQQERRDALVIDTFDSGSDNNDTHNSVDENENITDNNHQSSVNSNSSPNDHENMNTRGLLLHEYEGPELTDRMKEYVDRSDFSKFNPHTKMRRDLLTLLFEDVTKSHQLLYPSNDKYLTMAKGLAKKLRIPSAQSWATQLKKVYNSIQFNSIHIA